ncbi:MAG: leucine-rich repeat protein [Bacteroidales bacterium]|nr:leucine-rich repeat protein [Bacteroidales bacterium]
MKTFTKIASLTAVLLTFFSCKPEWKVDIALNVDSLTLEVGEKAEIIATLFPAEEAENVTIKWSSNNDGVATVVDGVVTAVGKGTVIISAQAGRKTAECSITVPSQPLTFTAADWSRVTLHKFGNPYEINLKYKISGHEWERYNYGETIRLSPEESLYFLAEASSGGRFSKDEYNYYCFDIDGSVSASGNIMSLVDDKKVLNILTEYCFYHLFFRCYGLTHAPDLTMKKMEKGCFYGMFANCYNLEDAPDLPSTQLADMCYYEMFLDCSSLTAAPELPAKVVKEKCYSQMFMNCRSLKETPKILPALDLENDCYSHMFAYCRELKAAPDLPSKNLARGCYSAMFAGCSKLDVAPELPATTLAPSCYECMFMGTAITNAPLLPAIELTDFCYTEMFSQCKNLSVAPELPAKTLTQYCYCSMFQDCTNLIKAPDLPAKELAEHCYEEMFNGCSKLNYVKALFVRPESRYPFQAWLADVSVEGVFIRNPLATWLTHDMLRLPQSWRIIDNEITEIE